MASWNMKQVISFGTFLCGFGALAIQNCDSPPVMRNGNYSQTGTVIMYSCGEGYEMRGQSTLQCINSTWVPPSPPTCQRQACPNVEVVSHASKNYYGTAYPGQVVSYTCSYGYTRTGPVWRTTCQTNLTWTLTNFSCNVFSCGPPPPLFGGTLVGVTKTDYRGVATYKCSPGYKMRSPQSYHRLNDLMTYPVTCGPRGWGKMPQCLPVSCGDSRIVPNAGKRVEGSNVYGDSAFYECAPGYQILGNSTVQCQSDGKWSPAPSCHRKSCGRPNKVPNASIVSMNGDNSFGAQVFYACKKGYESRTSTVIVCQTDETWTADPECLPRDCGIPAAIHFGSRTFSNTTFGSEATYECEINFNLVGYDVIRCGENGLWDEAPLCEGSLKGSRFVHTDRQTSGSSNKYQHMMYILAIVFAILAILLIPLIIVIVRVYGFCGKGSTAWCIPGSGILTKPGSPAAKDHMSNRLDGNEHGF